MQTRRVGTRVPFFRGLLGNLRLLRFGVSGSGVVGFMAGFEHKQ